MKHKIKLPELLAPAGDFEKMKIALHYGADAVYLGLFDFSLRAKADNFTPADLELASGFIRLAGKKFYVTINIFPHNKDISLIREHLQFLRKIEPDGVIVSDPGVLEMAREEIPDLPIHISTQANVTNYQAAKFWEKAGAKRIVLSREITLDEIKEIRDNVGVELECFVHGAICISYSGRCYLSSFMANRSANLGLCTNSCRWRFTLMEEKRPGQYFPVYENDRGTFVLSSRGLCLIEYLDKLAEAGVDSFKIEGRMKGINYLAGVVKTYREAIDSLSEGPYRVQDHWQEELLMFSDRGYSTGMLLGKPSDKGYAHDEEVYKSTHEFAGVVLSVKDNMAYVALRSKIKIGDTLTFVSKDSKGENYILKNLFDSEVKAIEVGKNEEIVLIPVENRVKENDIMRRVINP